MGISTVSKMTKLMDQAPKFHKFGCSTSLHQNSDGCQPHPNDHVELNELFQTGLRIRTLTALLSGLRRQVKQPGSSAGRHVSSTLDACSHFATLLTRGPEDSIAVAAKLTSETTQLTVSASVGETDSPPDEPHTTEAIATRNPVSHSIDVFQIQVIQPSGTSLATLAQRDDPVQDDNGLVEYAQDLLAAIRDLRTSRAPNFHPFRQFVVSSCLAEIGQRLASDQHIVSRPLDKILYDWMPLPNETFTPKQIPVASALVPLLDRLGAPVSDDCCQWSPTTAPVWIKLLAIMINVAKTAVGKCRVCSPNDTGRGSRMRIDANEVTRADGALWLLLVIVSFPLWNVFNLDSMRNKLSQYALESESPLAPDVVDDAELPQETISASVLRYLDNIVAWHRAAQYVYSGMQKHMGEISLTIVRTPAPLSYRACAPSEPIVAGAMDKAFHSLDIEDSERASLVQMVRDKVPGRTYFSGTVHCEVSLMGLIASSTVDVGSLPDYLPQATVQSTFKGLMTERGIATIGVRKKCCWCCVWLAKRLHSLHPEIKFDLPPSDGQIHPWTLPPVGISIDDALALESELGEIWDRAVRKLVEDGRVSKLRSHMSSPSGSVPATPDPEFPPKLEEPLVAAILETSGR
ncbi:hypothetical protein BS47DRAFT_1488448 [Hydnum rufescens UP504]|uniref:Uncharacterized protein n=1 Tax=Hydnum rufescens UP504 TaxID=1448309 RepID=A0A9P6DNT1_9AGAM|nr:hypothetical protein BS47DRAFT_1488448 [Hydnum rufescens UP504]